GLLVEHQEVLFYIKITEGERTLLIAAKRRLDKKEYLPKIIGGLTGDLPSFGNWTKTFTSGKQVLFKVT
ncbi:hypothetical protein, partial [Lactobacillus acidipiscis]